MASTQKSLPKSHNFTHFIGPSYESALNQSIQALLQSLHSSNSPNLSSFTSNFDELVQAKTDPPLETIWVFSALTFLDPNTPKLQPLDRISTVRALFQLIVSCSACCNSIKSIALVAPVVYNLVSFIVDTKGSESGSKKEKKINKEIRSLVDSIIGYLNVCCGGFDGNYDRLEGLTVPLEDLVSFWVVGRDKESFFPLLTKGIVERASDIGCGVAELSGFVIAEVFLLKLCLKIREDGFGKEMQKELRSWIVGSVTGFRSSHFYVTLLKMLLEPVLPVISIVDSESEVALRKVLCDALILVEYSFMKPGNLAQLPANHAKSTIMSKLVVFHEAVELARKNGNHAKAIDYLNAFSSSSLPSQLTRLVRSEAGSEVGSGPNGSSPKAFLRWMLNIENRGIIIFDNDMSKFGTKIVSDLSEEEPEVPVKEGKKSDTDLLFYIDNKGQQENKEEEDTGKSMSEAFMSAAQSIQSSEHEGRKRKAKKGEKKKQEVKFVKYNLDNSLLSAERSAAPIEDQNCSGSEVEDPDSDEDL